ncbi:MAG: hypothetical protein RI996_393 [Candidatus Parcubacteria bacterium]|jgi:hypothetical protein
MNTTTLKKFATTHPYITALLFYIVINLVGGYSITLFVDIKEVYTALNTPWWAPATWVFEAVNLGSIPSPPAILKNTRLA